MTRDLCVYQPSLYVDTGTHMYANARRAMYLQSTHVYYYASCILADMSTRAKTCGTYPGVLCISCCQNKERILCLYLRIISHRVGSLWEGKPGGLLALWIFRCADLIRINVAKQEVINVCVFCGNFIV